MGSCASAAGSGNDSAKSGSSPKKSKSRVSHTSTSINVDKSSPSKTSGRFSLAVGGNSSPVRSRTPAPQLPPQVSLPSIAHLPNNVQKLLCGRMDASVQHDSRMIKIYISACVTDSHEERDILYERVYPKLRLYCAERGFEFDVIDLHWGLRDEHTDDLYLKHLCVTQLMRCKNVTQGPSLCVFVHEKVGPACPATVPAAEFDKALKKADASEKQLLTHWFKRDDNADPPHYVLQTVETHLPEYQDDDIDAHATACQIWTNMAAKIGQAFARVNVKATSDLEDELEAAFGHVDLNRSSIIWVNRTFQNFHPDGSSALSYLYSDMAGGAKDPVAENRLKSLWGVLRNKVDSTRTLKFNVTWKEKPLDPTDNEHAQYLEMMSEKLHGQLQEMIDKTIEAVIEKTRKQPKTGLSENLMSDLLHHSQICQSLATPFIGQTEVLNKLYKYITDSNSPKRPLVIHGSDGSGRSSLAAMLALNGCTLPDWAGSSCVIRFMGMTPSCMTLEQTLHSVQEQICILSGQHTAQAYQSLDINSDFFPALLQKASSPLIIIIDGLDHAHPALEMDMSWVPTELPSNVCLILTTNKDCDSYSALQGVLPEECFFEIPPLSLTDATSIIDDLLGVEGRVVTAEQQNHILAAIKAVPNPLYCRILAQMAISVHSYSPLSQLPAENTLDEQVQALFTNLEHKIGAASVAGALGYLTAVQNGLTDSHMNDLLSCNEAVLHELHKLHSPAVRRAPPYFWASISTELMPFLYEFYVNGVRYLTWRHELFRHVAQERYQGSDTTLSGSILDYLSGRWANGKKMPYLKETEGKDRFVMSQEDRYGDFYNHWKLNEIVYQLHRCKRTGKLRDECLLNVAWLKMRLQASGPHQLLYDLSLGLHSEPGNKDLQVMYEFIQKAGSALSQDAEQILPQIYHRCKDGRAKESAFVKKLYDQASKPSQPFLSPSKPCVKTLNSSERTAETADIIHEGLFRIKGDVNHMVTVNSEEGRVCVWNIHSGELVRTLTGLTQPKNVKMATTENAVILCNREIHIYNLDSGDLVSKLKGVLNIKMPYYGIHDIDHTIALSRNRMYVNIMNNGTGDMVATFKVGEDRFLNSLIVSDNGQVCVCGDEVQKPFPLLVWDLVNRKLVHDLRIHGHEFTTSISDITANGHYAVCACKELDYPDPNFIVVYDLQSGAIFKKWQADYNTTCVAISSEGNCVVSGHEGGNVLVWDLVGGSNKYTFKGHRSAPDTVCMNDAGTRCATYDSQGVDLSIRLWDIQKGESLGAFIPDLPVSCCQISANGECVVISIPGYDDVITLRVHTKSGPPSPKKESGVYGDASRKGKVFDVTQA